jgi:hypothetical protein
MDHSNLQIHISQSQECTLTDFINLYRGKRSRSVAFKITPMQHRYMEAYAVAFDISRAELAYRGFLATLDFLTQHHPLPGDTSHPGLPTPSASQLSLFDNG